MISVAKVSTNVTIDEVTKKEAQALLADFGMDLSTAVNIFLKQMVYEGSFPFSITREVPNAVTRAAIKATENDEDMYGPFNSVEELMESLNA